MISNVYQSETAGWQVWRSTSTTAATTSPPAVVLHTGGGVLPVLAYYTASGGREAAGAAQVRSGQASWATATTGPAFELSLSLSLPHPCFVRVWCASTYRGHRPASAFLLRHRASSIYAVPRSMKPGHAEVESCRRRLPVVLPASSSLPPAA